MTQAEFDNKLTSFIKQITSNITKHLEFQKKLDSLITKNYSYRGRIFFTSNDESQNIFVYQPTLNVLELKKDKVTEYTIGWKSKGLYNSKLRALHGVFLPSGKNLITLL